MNIGLSRFHIGNRARSALLETGPIIEKEDNGATTMFYMGLKPVFSGYFIPLALANGNVLNFLSYDNIPFKTDSKFHFSSINPEGVVCL